MAHGNVWSAWQGSAPYVFSIRRHREIPGGGEPQQIAVAASSDMQPDPVFASLPRIDSPRVKPGDVVEWEVFGRQEAEAAVNIDLTCDRQLRQWNVARERQTADPIRKRQAHSAY